MSRFTGPSLRVIRLSGLTGLNVAIQRDGTLSLATPPANDPAMIEKLEELSAAPTSVDEAFRAEYEEMSKRLAAYHAAQKTKYERAASRPWMFVAPDSPPQ